MALNGKEKLFVSSGGAGRSAIPLDEVAAFIAGSIPPPAGAVVTNNEQIAIKNGAGTTVEGTAVVTGTTLTQVNLPPSTTAFIDGQVVSIRTSTGADTHFGTAVVATNGVLTGVNITAPTTVMVDSGDTNVTVTNSGGTNVITGTTAAVSAGALAIHLPTTVVAVLNGVKLTVPITGTFVNGITLTVSGGIVTAGVLS